MKCGCILYERETAKERKGYIDLYRKYFAEYGVQMRLLFTDNYRKELEKAGVDFAIVRVIAPEISKELEEMGITVYNNSVVSEICNDKWKTYQYIQAHTDVSFLRTVTAEEFLLGENDFSYPMIVKSRTGHGGTEVFQVFSYEEATCLIAQYPPHSLLVQEKASDSGRDVRVFVVGTQVIAAMLRISETDFRSNYCLGGRAEPYLLSQKERRMVTKIMELFHFGMAGIDFIFHEGEAVFNEIEDVVGARMLYDKTNIDIVKEYVDWIVKQEGGTAKSR